MVRFSRVCRVGLRMGHPQVRWSVLLMTQHGGTPAQLQGDGEGVKALPLNWVECGNIYRKHSVAWFHVAMRLTVLDQYGTGLVHCDAVVGKEIQEKIARLKWSLWHGQVDKALGTID